MTEALTPGERHAIEAILDSPHDPDDDAAIAARAAQRLAERAARAGDPDDGWQESGNPGDDEETGMDMAAIHQAAYDVLPDGADDEAYALADRISEAVAESLLAAPAPALDAERLREIAEALDAQLQAALPVSALATWPHRDQRWMPAENLDPITRLLPCPIRSSLTDQPCTLLWGHPQDSGTRFHRFAAERAARAGDAEPAS